MIIKEFRGKYRWLSNFSKAPVEFEGEVYPTTEHAYQAAKFTDPEVRKIILTQETPGKAKQQARKFPIDKGFNTRKLAVMRHLLEQKFRIPYYRDLLLETGDDYIEEGNTWGDTFWGVCKGEGENNLGKLIMEIREEIRS